MAKKQQQQTPTPNKVDYNVARTGLDPNSSENQIKKGDLTYALNAMVSGFGEGSAVNYQNEPGNKLCFDFPEGMILIGNHFIVEQDKHVLFLADPVTEMSEIGYVINDDCVYHTLVRDACLGFDVTRPIHKIVHKTTNCSVEIYWADNVAMRFLDLENIPYKLVENTDLCDPEYTDQLDCNQLRVQPKVAFPLVSLGEITPNGEITTGSYQFSVQYADELSAPLTEYFGVSNGCSIKNEKEVTTDYSTRVSKSIRVDISNLDTTGQYEHFNLAVIKTTGGVTSFDLVGTFSIGSETESIVYSGQAVSALSSDDLFERFPSYERAEGVTSVRDTLIWNGLTSKKRINYQSIASKVTINWQTHKIPRGKDYSDSILSATKRSYLRDEVYPFELAFVLADGKTTDGFHIPGRIQGMEEAKYEDVPQSNADFIGEPDYYKDVETEEGIVNMGFSPYWKIYNTAVATSRVEDGEDPYYEGPYEEGTMGYWESEEEYPCDPEVWGELSGKKIRHHKFPDTNVSPIMENKTYSPIPTAEENALFPLGVKVRPSEIYALVQASDLTQAEKDDIVGFRILRGDRSSNTSIVAKGILRNVGKYTKKGEEFYYPNYPYNDTTEDVFHSPEDTPLNVPCTTYTITIESLNAGEASISYFDCYDVSGIPVIKTYTSVGSYQICAKDYPLINTGSGNVKLSTYDTWIATSNWNGEFIVRWRDIFDDIQEARIKGSNPLRMYVRPGDKPYCISSCGRATIIYKESSVNNDLDCAPDDSDTTIDAINSQSTFRQVFNSPETSFGSPFLGSVLKLENIIFGNGVGHFSEVEDNAKYRLASQEIQKDSAESAAALANITGTFSPEAFNTAYQMYLGIYTSEITKRNFAYSYNSIANYNYYSPVENGSGQKQRELDISTYLLDAVQSVGDDNPVNNFQRESSVYIKTSEDKAQLPFPEDNEANLDENGDKIFTEHSRFLMGSLSETPIDPDNNDNCDDPGKNEPISVLSYYGSIKNIVPSQWGQIYSYKTLDTGTVVLFDDTTITSEDITVFGGDTFISKFSFKTKLPFFTENRVGGVDEANVFYDEIGNIPVPRYYHSSTSVPFDITAGGVTMRNLGFYKLHNFDCPVDTASANKGSLARSYYNGVYYAFAYGIPTFYCETSYNLDLRQATNNKEGDFYPRVGNGIPDEWLQEKNVPIALDNTYNYNTAFSKQNRENLFTHLPLNWEDKQCYTYYPFRGVYSDVQSTNASVRTNNWLIYRAVSFFDFPQDHGKMITLEGIQNKNILARFENTTLLYNSLTTLDTNNPQSVYVGNANLFSGSLPIDLSFTDIGYMGTQNAFMLNTPQGQISIDAKRGQVFLIQGNKPKDLTDGMQFFKNNLPFNILDYFPPKEETIDGEQIITEGIDTDNNYLSIGLHGVYDDKFNRIIITKLDYIPLKSSIYYDTEAGEFFIPDTDPETGEDIDVLLDLTDEENFCNKSWTMSYSFITGEWVSHHSYLPNFYLEGNGLFYSGENDSSTDFDFIATLVLEDTPTTTTTTTGPYYDTCGDITISADEEPICTPLTAGFINLFPSDVYVEQVYWNTQNNRMTIGTYIPEKGRPFTVDLYRNNVPSGFSQLVEVGDPTSLVFEDNNSGGGESCYTIRSHNDFGTSPMSNSVCGYNPNDTPDLAAPYIQKVDDYHLVRWSAAGAGVPYDYELQQSINGAAYVTVQTATISGPEAELNFSYTPLVEGDFAYKVINTGAGGITESTPITVSYFAPTSPVAVTHSINANGTTIQIVAAHDAPATKYTTSIERKDNAGSTSFVEVYSSEVGDLPLPVTFNDNNLPRAITYTYRVINTNAFGSETSAEFSYYVPLEVPAAATISANYVDDLNVDVTTPLANDGNSYWARLFREEEGGGFTLVTEEYITPTYISENGNSWVVTDTAANYNSSCYEVRFETVDGGSVSSNKACVTTIPEPLTPPVIVTTIIDYTKVEVRYPAITGTAYTSVLYIKEDGETEFSVLTTVQVPNVSAGDIVYEHTPPLGNNCYKVEVYREDTYNTTTSNESCELVVGAPQVIPDVPTLTINTDSNTSNLLGWSKSTVGFPYLWQLYRKQPGDGDFISISGANGTITTIDGDLSWTDTELVEGTTEYRLEVSNNGGTQQSNVVSAVRLVPATPVFTLLEYSEANGGMFLNWTAAETGDNVTAKVLRKGPGESVFTEVYNQSYGAPFPDPFTFVNPVTVLGSYTYKIDHTNPVGTVTSNELTAAYELLPPDVPTLGLVDDAVGLSVGITVQVSSNERPYTSRLYRRVGSSNTYDLLHTEEITLGYSGTSYVYQDTRYVEGEVCYKTEDSNEAGTSISSLECITVTSVTNLSLTLFAVSGRIDLDLYLASSPNSSTTRIYRKNETTKAFELIATEYRGDTAFSGRGYLYQDLTPNQGISRYYVTQTGQFFLPPTVSDVKYDTNGYLPAADAVATTSTNASAPVTVKFKRLPVITYRYSVLWKAPGSGSFVTLLSNELTPTEDSNGDVVYTHATPGVGNNIYKIVLHGTDDVESNESQVEII